MRTIAIRVQLVILAAFCPQAPVPAQTADGIGEADLARIRELFHLTDAVGERLWPGFDTRKIPIAVNHEDRQELLVGHPRPPEEFEDYRSIDGVPTWLREGCTRYGPKGGGWSVTLGGEETAYVGTFRGNEPLEDWLSLLLHECFHVYQDRYRGDSEGAWQEPPEDDPGYNAMIGLESRVLHAAITADDEGEARALAAAFVAVRHDRRKGRAPGLVRYESEYEFSEGTATYVQARLMQALSQELGLVPAGNAPGYRAFADAGERYARYLARILPSENALITFFHSQYQNGMAQCLLLDRVRPGWKEEMRQKGSTQFALLEKTFPMTAEEEADRLAQARQSFDYETLLAFQEELVAERVALVRSYLEAPGRRYRVFHGDLRSRFNWKPEGPVYHVPESLMPDSPRGRATVWAGGIRKFDQGDLVFRGEAVPMIFRHDYLEWIDPDPAADGSDLVIQSDRIVDGVHHGLNLITDGFSLQVPRARIERSDDVVAIHPIGGDG